MAAQINEWNITVGIPKSIGSIFVQRNIKKKNFLYFQILKTHRRRTLKIFLSMIRLSPCTSIIIVQGLILLLKEMGVCVKIVWENKFHPLWKLLGFLIYGKRFVILYWIKLQKFKGPKIVLDQFYNGYKNTYIILFMSL